MMMIKVILAIRQYKLKLAETYLDPLLDVETRIRECIFSCEGGLYLSMCHHCGPKKKKKIDAAVYINCKP